jgi:hypothetical protein
MIRFGWLLGSEGRGVSWVEFPKPRRHRVSVTVAKPSAAPFDGRQNAGYDGAQGFEFGHNGKGKGTGR